MCTCNDNRTYELLKFVDGLNLQDLCDVASKLNKGLLCVAGGWSCGGYNIIQELAFEDGSCWLARIPRPDNSVLHDPSTSSYSAVLRYLKKNSSIPVPTVFHHALSTDKTNKVGASYVLMEKLPGKQLPPLGQTKDEPYDRDRPTRQEIRLTRKIHEQLTEIIIELARHQFDRIGALHEDENGTFTVKEYFDPIWIGCSSERAKIFQSLQECDRGPYDSITAYYLGIAELNYRQALAGPPEVYGPEGVDLYETLADMSLSIILPEFDNGPFVIAHNDLTLQNILVDDDFNITGILDFPGNIVPLPSLCVYPWMFHWNAWGAMSDREEFEHVFLSKHSDNGASPIASVASRRQIMEHAIDRNYFERSLLGSFAFVFVPTLHERLYGETYEYKKPDEVAESGTDESQPDSDSVQDSPPESNSSLASDAGELIGGKSDADSELDDFSNAESIITSTPARATTKPDVPTQTEPYEGTPPHSLQLVSLESCSAELLELVTAGKPKRSKRGLSSWWKGFMPGRTDGSTRKRKSRFLYQLDKLGMRRLHDA